MDIGRSIYEVELHEGAGGPGAAACSGDLLLGALAACSQLTAQAVAENFGVDVDISVEAIGDLDLRGTLGVGSDVPIEIEDIRADIEVETRAALEKATKRNLMVYQTLEKSPAVETPWWVQQ